MPNLQPFNPNIRKQRPLLFDNAVPINELPQYELEMGHYTRASAYRDAVLNFSNNQAVQTNEQQVLQNFAMMLASTQLPVYRINLRGQTVRITLNDEFNRLYNELVADPAVQVMAGEFARDPQRRQQMLQQNGQYNRTHFLTSLVNQYNELNDPQLQQGNNAPQQNLNQENPQQNLNQGNPQQNLNQGNPQQNLNQGNPQQNLNQANPPQNQDLNQANPHVVNPVPNPGPVNPNQNINQQGIVNDGAAAIEDDDDDEFVFLDREQLNAREQQRNARENINQNWVVGDQNNDQVVEDIYQYQPQQNQNPNANAQQGNVPPQQNLDPEDEFVFQEGFGGANYAGNRNRPRRRRNLAINQPAQDIEGPRVNADDIMRGIPQNQPNPNPQNDQNLQNAQNIQNPQEEEEEAEEFYGANLRVRRDEQGQMVYERVDHNALMEPYDPAVPHQPPRVLDSNVPAAGLPVFNRRNYTTAVEPFSQVRNFPNNPQNAFSDVNTIRNHIAGTLALSEMVLFHAQTPEGDVPVIDADEFNERYNRFLNDPQVGRMAQDFFLDPGYRRNLLGGQNVSADAFIRNTVNNYRERTLAARQQQRENRQNQGRQLNNPGFWNAGNQNPQPPAPNQDPNMQPNPQVNPVPEFMHEDERREQEELVREVDLNDDIFVNPNENIEGVREDVNPQPREEFPGGQMTYRQYMDSIAESVRNAPPNADINEGIVANMLAVQMLMTGAEGPNVPVDWERVGRFSMAFRNTESFREMIQTRPHDVRRALENGDGVILVGTLAEVENALSQRMESYRRPDDRLEDDAAFLKNVNASLKKKHGEAKSPDKIEKKNPLYQQMVQKWKHFENLTGKPVVINGVQRIGMQPRGTQVKELIDITKRYINKGSDVPGGADLKKRVPAFKEAMCMLKRYMPPAEFEEYCSQINEAQRTTIAEPSAFLPGRVTGVSVTGEELMNQLKKDIKKSPTNEQLATLAAIHNLTRGRVGLIVQPSDVERERLRLMKPGSAFLRTLQDPQSRKKIEDYVKNGKVKKIAATLVKSTGDHVERTAAGQFGLAARMIGSGPLNRYMATKALAMALASHRAAASADPGTLINNRAFREKAEEIEQDPAFQRLMDRYMADPEFRNHMNEELTRPDATGASLEMALDRQRTNPRINRNPLPQALRQQNAGNAARNVQNPQNVQNAQNVQNRQANRPVQNAQQNPVEIPENAPVYDPRDMRPDRRKMMLDDGVGANGLPEYRGENYSLADASRRRIDNFAQNPQADEMTALRIFAGTLAGSTMPVYRLEVDGMQQKVVDVDLFNQKFMDYMNDPTVKKMARDFAANPQYRENILHGNNEHTASGMIANINKEFVALKRQEAQINRRQENLRQQAGPNIAI